MSTHVSLYTYYQLLQVSCDFQPIWLLAPSSAEVSTAPPIKGRSWRSVRSVSGPTSSGAVKAGLGRRWCSLAKRKWWIFAYGVLYTCMVANRFIYIYIYIYMVIISIYIIYIYMYVYAYIYIYISVYYVYVVCFWLWFMWYFMRWCNYMVTHLVFHTVS